MGWFDVDKAGLANILERRGKAFALFELVANAWDSGGDRVAIMLEPLAGVPYATLTVEDNGEGFADLSHAHTMFTRSARADKADKRGRFNLGEKLVLACCRKAIIMSAGGSLEFREDGNVRRHAGGRATGTHFAAEIRMTRDEYAEVCRAMRRLIPPVATMFNGQEIDRPDSIARFRTKLPTEIMDADGLLRRSVATAEVEVYEADGDCPGEILEMGIPVVETESGFRVNVLQKIPLNMDRDNVTPAFLRAVNVALLNQVHDRLTADQAASPWVQEASGDARAQPETVKAVIVKRFGERAVVATPGDPVANAQAEAAGFTVVPGGALSADVWANVRKANILLPSGQVFPTPKPDTLAAQNAAAQKCPTCGRPM
jgi:hypothetical protein